MLTLDAVGLTSTSVVLGDRLGHAHRRPSLVEEALGWPATARTPSGVRPSLEPGSTEASLDLQPVATPLCVEDGAVLALHDYERAPAIE